jgi:hypothetical protein
VVEVAHVDTQLHCRSADDRGILPVGELLLSNQSISATHRAVMNEHFNAGTRESLAHSFCFGAAFDEHEALLAPSDVRDTLCCCFGVLTEVNV